MSILKSIFSKWGAVTLMTLLALTTSAQARLFIQETGYGAVTQAEIDEYDNWYDGYILPSNNDEKKYTWYASTVVRSQLRMYELTGDIKYLDDAIVICDHLLNTRDPASPRDIDYVTQRDIRGWPYYKEQFTDANENIVPYFNIVGQGMILNALGETALVIRSEPTSLGASYETAAENYIDAGNEVIDDFINYTEWYDSGTNLFYFPDLSRHDEVLYGLRGKKIAYNRSLVMSMALFHFAAAMDLYSEQASRVSDYQTIIDANLDDFWAATTLNGSGVTGSYSWNYREEGKGYAPDQDPPKLEDIGHGGLDIRALVLFHEQTSFSGLGPVTTDTQMRQLANSLTEVMLAEPPRQFCWYFDGSDCDKDPVKANRHTMCYIGLSKYSSKVYNNATWQLRNDGSQQQDKYAIDYAEYLLEKQRVYDTHTHTGPTTIVSYDFVGVTTSTNGMDAYACDVDKFPFTSSADRNSMVEASNNDYTAISVDNSSQWASKDPGSNDEIFLWLEMDIAESVSSIGQLNFKFDGNTDGNSASDHQLWVFKGGVSGAVWSEAAYWEEIGVTLSIEPDTDTSVMGSIIDNIGDYIDGSGVIIWGLYTALKSEDLRINTVEMEVVNGDGIQIWGSQVTKVPVSADSFVKRGTATTNYGSDTDVRAKDGFGSSSNDRKAYLKYDLSGISGTISEAVLNFQYKTSVSGTISASFYEVSDDSWTESGLIWDNKPSMGALISTENFTGTTYVWDLIDVTSYVTVEESGDGIMTIGVADTTEQNEQWFAKSKEAGASEGSYLQVVWTAQ